MGSIGTLFPAEARAWCSAYAPCPGLTAGAALRPISGAIFSGANIENAVSPIGTGAGACAIAALAAAGAGAGRQRIREFAGEDTTVHAAGITGVRATFPGGALMLEGSGPGIAKAGS